MEKPPNRTLVAGGNKVWKKPQTIKIIQLQIPMTKYNSYKYITLQRARMWSQEENWAGRDVAKWWRTTLPPHHHVELEEHRPHRAISKKISECIQNTWKCALELHTHPIVPIDKKIMVPSADKIVNSLILYVLLDLSSPHIPPHLVRHQSLPVCLIHHLQFRL